MDATTYSERRRHLRESVAAGAILIVGNSEASRNYTDNVYPFRQDSHFLYFAGVRQPGCAALLLPEGREVLYGPAEHLDDVVWFGPHPTLADHAAAAGIRESAPSEDLREELAGLAGAGVRVHYLPPYRGDRRLKLADLLSVDLPEVDRGVSADLVSAVVALRSVKTGAEVAEIEEALAVTVEMYRGAMRTVRAGLLEAEIAGVMQGAALARDRQQAFTPIVSVRGEVLHNTSYANTLADGDLLLIDSGAESPQCYASDITRTLPVSGRFTPEQSDVYSVVLQAQLAVIDAASPSCSNRELHMLAARTITEGLKGMGLMKGDVDDAVAAGAHALFMPHGIGHMLGLDVHDMEDLGDAVGYPAGEARSEQFGLNFLRLARQLQPGFVITVEPGVYFVPALIDRWREEGRHREFIAYDRLEGYRSFGGVRIEDDVLITDAGCRVLGPGIPKSVVEVEEAVGG